MASTIERRPRAPLFRSIALVAMASARELPYNLTQSPDTARHL
jgi:hypothetical protein